MRDPTGQYAPSIPLYKTFKKKVLPNGLTEIENNLLDCVSCFIDDCIKKPTATPCKASGRLRLDTVPLA